MRGAKLGGLSKKGALPCARPGFGMAGWRVGSVTHIFQDVLWIPNSPAPQIIIFIDTFGTQLPLDSLSADQPVERH